MKFTNRVRRVAYLTLSTNSLPFTIPSTEQWRMMSTYDENKEYRIFVYLPTGTPPVDGYPILYLLDANALFGSMVEAVRLQTRKPHGYDPIVVVGIGYETNEPFDLEGRFLDYTIPASVEELPLRKNGMEWPKVGGADLFIHFIENELKPKIEARYPINKSKQALFGHSLGGFFTIYTLFNKTDAFQTYIAGSPSIWWKNQYLTSLENTFCQTFKENKYQEEKSLFIGVGGKEKQSMIEDARDMYDRLLAQNMNPFRLDFRKFDEEGHVTVLHPFISRALEFFLGKKD